jgi:hypothetical protein
MACHVVPSSTEINRVAFGLSAILSMFFLFSYGNVTALLLLRWREEAGVSPAILVEVRKRETVSK